MRPPFEPMGSCDDRDDEALTTKLHLAIRLYDEDILESQGKMLFVAGKRAWKKLRDSSHVAELRTQWLDRFASLNDTMIPDIEDMEPGWAGDLEYADYLPEIDNEEILEQLKDWSLEQEVWACFCNHLEKNIIHLTEGDIVAGAEAIIKRSE